MEHLLCARNSDKGMNSVDPFEESLGGRHPYYRRGREG